MSLQRQQLGFRLLCLTALAGGLTTLTGCNLLEAFSVRPIKAEAVKTDTVRGNNSADPAGLPGKHHHRVEQYVFLADFEIKRDLPLFKELAAMRDQVHKTLHLPTSANIVQVYLFEDCDRYERFMKSKYPELPKRRAFFIAQPRAMGGEDLLVYTYWGSGDRIQKDLRHELTHALLHSVLKDVPLWLDEGLAEYFELPPNKPAVNVEHLTQLCRGSDGPGRADLARLEQLTQVDQMTPTEYREAWAWVHLMLHGNDEARRVLIGYLRDLRTTKNPGSLRTRLTFVFPTPEIALERHLSLLDQSFRPVNGVYWSDPRNHTK